MRSRRATASRIAAAALLAALAAGCANVRIDPTGQALFVVDPPYSPYYPAPVAAAPVYVPGPVAPTTPYPPTVPYTPTIPATPSRPVTPSTPTPVPQPPPLRPTPTARPAVLSLRATGPLQAALNTTASFRVEVQNAGESPATDVILSNRVPAGLVFLSSSPPESASGSELEWRLGNIAARETKVIEVNYRVERPGSIENCFSARNGVGLSARNCAVTTVAGASLQLQVNGPNQAVVGSEVEYVIEIINPSAVTATGLTIADRFDPGLQHAAAASPIVRELGEVKPNQRRRIAVSFRVTRAGRLCHTVEITGDGGIRQTMQACLLASEAAPAPAPSQVTLQVTGPEQRRVGELAEFTLEVFNASPRPLGRFSIVAGYDAALEPKQATQGFSYGVSELSWAIDDLAPGQRLRRVAQFQCRAPAARTCILATVTDGDRLRVRDETCLEVLPAAPVGAASPGAFSMRIVERTDPAAVDSLLDYQVIVTNGGVTPQRQVVLSVNFSEEFQIDSVPGPLRGKINGQAVDFVPIAQMQPGESVAFNLRVRAARAGDGRISAGLVSQGTAQPIVAKEQTRIFSQR